MTVNVGRRSILKGAMAAAMAAVAHLMWPGPVGGQMPQAQGKSSPTQEDGSWIALQVAGCPCYIKASD